MPKKIMILLPDGVGLRNFAYSDFYTIGKAAGHDVIFWNNTPFDLKKLGFEEIPLQQARLHKFTSVFKRVRTIVELNLNSKKSGDKTYQFYKFKSPSRSLKDIGKNMVVRFLSWWYGSDEGRIKVRSIIKELESKTVYHEVCLKLLKQQKPDLLFCTSQRSVLGISPIMAAKKLGIPTVTFIFSWDNLPKATLDIEADYYFVWSEHMKKELLKYHSFIYENQIIITGTPQFEGHYKHDTLLSRDAFCTKYHLDTTKDYICYSGDDITTSPDDPQYLNDLAVAVHQLNENGKSLGIIFRKCPTDFSNRYDKVLRTFEDIIKPIAPIWEKQGDVWNTILPKPEDLALLQNTAKHCKAVVNLGSSMVFDFVIHANLCLYVNYDAKNKIQKDWSTERIYSFIHFRSMPEKNAVYWIESPKYFANQLESALQDSHKVLSNTKKWFEKINIHPPERASQRIWEAIETIAN